MHSVRTTEGPIEPEDVATALAKAALEKKAFDLCILDMRGLVDYCDIFVLCSARNRRQVQAIAEFVRQHGKRELRLKPQATELLGNQHAEESALGELAEHLVVECSAIIPQRGVWSKLRLREISSELSKLQLLLTQHIVIPLSS